MEKKNKSSISVVIITKNADDTIAKCIESTKQLTHEVIVVDDYSSDNTTSILKKHDIKLVLRHEIDLGNQKRYAISLSKSKWILLLDSDEILTLELIDEIKRIIIEDSNDEVNGYYIKLRNHLFNRPLFFGGEEAKKLILFKKNTWSMKNSLIHEEISLIKGKAKILNEYLFHFSYRSVWQMYSKFTNYGIRSAKQKAMEGERTSLKKIFMYPPHLFWARYIKDKGYKDGPLRILLDLGFVWMEFLTYFLLLFFQKVKYKKA